LWSRPFEKVLFSHCPERLGVIPPQSKTEKTTRRLGAPTKKFPVMRKMKNEKVWFGWLLGGRKRQKKKIARPPIFHFLTR
jgi:hypothetical protein